MGRWYQRPDRTGSDRKRRRWRQRQRRRRVEAVPHSFDGKGAGAWLEKWENRKAKAYPDPNGRDTDIGVGYNLTGNGDQARADLAQLGLDYAQVLAGKIILTDAQIDSLLLLTMNRARDAAQRLFPNFGQMNTDQQIAVVDALFAFGASGFLDQFPKTVAALRAGDFATAAKELSDCAGEFPVEGLPEPLAVLKG